MAMHAVLQKDARHSRQPSHAAVAGEFDEACCAYLAYLSPKYAPNEYRIYKEMILRPLSVESLQGLVTKCGSARKALEAGLVMFMQELRHYVLGCDDRKFSRATMRRARGVESQLLAVAGSILVDPWRANVLSVDDLHGVWHGFVAMRGWRDCRVPQECLLRFLSGVLGQFDEAVAQEWKEHALNQELPLVQRSISVAAWPGLCQLLGQLPSCVTASELREALWKQAFVENPTRAPDHRNYKRFALLAAQMIAIGVELESERAELLVQQVLNLERPWRERRDMLSGILGAASVADRQKVVQNLDQRFEAHADLDDFEIVCGIAEHIGVEIPRDGAIRRCALRRWALDTKRGGALPVSRLMDFVDSDASIGQDVAFSLRQRGRIADAAMLLSRLPSADQGSDAVAGQVEMALGDVELGRLQQILTLSDDGAEGGQGEQCIFAPVDSAGFLLPFRGQAITTAEEALEACQRLRDAPVLAVQVFREEAPFWHRPASILAVCSDSSAELFDLTSLRGESQAKVSPEEREGTETEKVSLNPFGFQRPAGAEDRIRWPDAAARLRALLSDRRRLKCIWGGAHQNTAGEEEIIDVAYELGLGIATTLRPHEKDPLGPVLDTESLFQALMKAEESEVKWPSIVRQFLGFRLCSEEEGSNWARRPLRSSQLHHSAVLTWTQLLAVRAICAHGLVTGPFVRSHTCVQCRPRVYGRSRGVGKHVLGQLAPAGRLAAEHEASVAQTPWLWKGRLASSTGPPATRVVLLKGKAGEASEAVEMVGDLAGNMARIVPLGGPLDRDAYAGRHHSICAHGWSAPLLLIPLANLTFAVMSRIPDKIAVRSADLAYLISAGRVDKVEYILNGERCDKTLLRSSSHLRQELLAVPVAPAANAVAVSPPAACRFAMPGAPPLPYPQGPMVQPRPVYAQLPQPPQARQPLGVGAGHWLRVADLEFGELLGSGGFGAVHRGRLRGSPQEVAIKKLHVLQGGGVSQANLAEFQKEVNNLQALRHDRLIRLIGVAYDPPMLCIVTEALHGKLLGCQQSVLLSTCKVL
ncbi:KSR1 [Symbiodinium natans]|uniref:KSR1 protein n=1 Tax=Symbiodinium natans TaxID=878477 RepID=A0A812P2Q8_9DINO|nr:KSR1 [Symbiodinium natans]